MSNIFKNYELSFKYPNNWKLLEADDIENCIAVLDCDSKFSRVMVFKYPQEGLSMEYLKNAIEDIPREDSLIVEDSHLLSQQSMIGMHTALISSVLEKIIQIKKDS